MTDVIVLNGGSSSGKSSLARSLQNLLDEPRVTVGVDDLLAAYDTLGRLTQASTSGPSASSYGYAYDPAAFLLRREKIR